MNVVVIPQDRMIAVDGQALFFDFPAHECFHALHWDGGCGRIEYADGRPNAALTSPFYETIVAPYVAAYQKELERVQSRPGPYHEWDRETGQWVLNEASQKADRLGAVREERRNIAMDSVAYLRALALGKSTEHDLTALADLDDKDRALLTELAALNGN